MAKKDQKKLLAWYQENQRPLPWRQNRDPYRIWISETMLQQTTTTAVIPYFERFMNAFPTLNDLATAREQSVVAAWAGLGYYSRARNLHKAARLLNELNEFPQSYAELIKYPGFGPYTARAVSSLAFSEKVGVLDGNVIRVLTRYYGLKLEWWKTSARKQLQDEVDQWMQELPSEQMNQALMELGATVCTPQNPSCLLCPLVAHCQAHQQDLKEQLPLKKPKKAREVWLWQPEVHKKGQKIALIKNTYAPFLKGHWILPGQAKQTSKKPKAYDFRHSITHHDIFVTLCDSNLKMKSLKNNGLKWVPKDEIKEWIPASLVQKALSQFDKKS